ncbi:hypothetical protein [uncultured Kordia sp.]|uniref:hypothetical protein n=1 Tax=uncultured Kordia sp. TaxID=507699 RepID=UPI0026285365|nr:hypothetical protein [uncultured Kordia sp.]
MKKKSLKNLALRKNTISQLDKQANIKGGITGTWFSWIFTDCQQEPEPLPDSVFPRCNSNHGACPM